MATCAFCLKIYILLTSAAVVLASPSDLRSEFRGGSPILEDGLDPTTSAVSLSENSVHPDDLSNIPEQLTLNSTVPEVYSLNIWSNIKYRYATTLVTSCVVNRGSKSAEVIFQFFLPRNSFISGFLMEVKDKVYKAYVKEKEEAKNVYEAAIKRGQTAAHIAVTARESNLFAVSVNLESYSKMTFNLTYEELLTRRQGLYDEVIHLVTCDQVIQDMKVEVYINEPQKITKIYVPEPTTSTEDALKGGFVKISRNSPKSALITYKPSIKQQTELLRQAKVKHSSGLSEGEESASQRLRVQYDVDHQSTAGEILLDDGYFVHFFAPSEKIFDKSSKPNKHAIFVLDTSGSMFLGKLEQLKEAMDIILDSLNDKDYFSIIQFSTSANDWSLSHDGQHLGQNVHLATRNNIHNAKEYISRMEAVGGTNIADALTLALKIAESGIESNHLQVFNDQGSRSVAGGSLNKAQPMIIFLTDGEPTMGDTNLASILNHTKERNKNIKAPLFSLAFGDDPDFIFLKKMSLQNNGFARKIYSSADATLQLESFFREISSPLLNNVTFSYINSVVDQSTVTKSTFHTFFAGTEIIIAGKVKDKMHSPEDLRGTVSSTYYEVPFSGSSVYDPTTYNQPKHINPENTDDSRGRNSNLMEELESFAIKFWPSRTLDGDIPKHKLGSLERLWAFLTIRQLLDEDLASEDEKASTWTANKELQGKNAVSPAKKKALKLALKYGFVTPLTSLVVVKPPEKYHYSTNTSGFINDPMDANAYKRLGENNLFSCHGNCWTGSTAAFSIFSSARSKVMVSFFFTIVMLFKFKL